MRATLLVLLVLLEGLASVTGCTNRSRCAGKSRLELPNAEAALALRLVDTPDGARPAELDLCHPPRQRLGGLLWEGQTLILVDRAGAERMRAADGAALELSGPSGLVLRLWKGGQTLRVLKGDGVPYGSLMSVGPDQVLVSDPGGSPVARVSARDADAVLAAPDGATRGYVVPSPGLLPAAVAALTALPIEERAFLLVQLARPRFGPR